jgi:hypothetical protein
MIELFSDNETGLVSHSVISSNIRDSFRFTEDLYHASGFIFPYKKTEANLIPLANNLRSVRKNVRPHPVLCFARPRGIAILFKDERQTNCNRREKDRSTFRPQTCPVKSALVASGDLAIRAVTLKSVNFGQECFPPPVESTTSAQMRSRQLYRECKPKICSHKPRYRTKLARTLAVHRRHVF